MGARSRALRHAFVAAAYVGAIGFVLRWTGPFIGVPLRVQAPINALYYVALAIALGAKLVWAHGAWNALPPGCRVTALGRWVAPDEAAWGHFLPWRALTWQFTVHVGVAEATNSVLASYDTRAVTSTRIPFLACASLLVPGVNLVAFPALLYAHMDSVDRAQDEMNRCLAFEPVARPWVPPHRPSHLSLVIPMVVASLLLWIGVPVVLVNALAAALHKGDSSDTRTLSVATPERIEFHANRIAEAMATCARLGERTMPASFDACAEADMPVRVARIEGGAEYTWDKDTLTTRSLSGTSVHAKRRVVCARGTCTVTNEPLPRPSVMLTPPPDIEGDLDAMTASLVSCAQARHEVPDNLSDCPESRKLVDAANAPRSRVVYVFATPAITAWTPTYGHSYGRRRIVCNAGACASERVSVDH